MARTLLLLPMSGDGAQCSSLCLSAAESSSTLLFSITFHVHLFRIVIKK